MTEDNLMQQKRKSLRQLKRFLIEGFLQAEELPSGSGPRKQRRVEILRRNKETPKHLLTKDQMAELLLSAHGTSAVLRTMPGTGLDGVL